MTADMLDSHSKNDIYSLEENYPYIPDLVMGYKGNKVALFILNEAQTSKDTNEPLGEMLFR